MTERKSHASAFCQGLSGDILLRGWIKADLFDWFYSKIETTLTFMVIFSRVFFTSGVNCYKTASYSFPFHPEFLRSIENMSSSTAAFHGFSPLLIFYTRRVLNYFQEGIWQLGLFWWSSLDTFLQQDLLTSMFVFLVSCMAITFSFICTTLLSSWFTAPISKEAISSLTF